MILISSGYVISLIQIKVKGNRTGHKFSRSHFGFVVIYIICFAVVIQMHIIKYCTTVN